MNVQIDNHLTCKWLLYMVTSFDPKLESSSGHDRNKNIVKNTPKDIYKVYNYFYLKKLNTKFCN